MPEPQFEWVDIDLIEPNPWNPNAMDDEMYAKAIESIHSFGFVDPLTTRTVVGEPAPGRRVTHGQKADWLDVVRHQIIDGEHRWRAGKDHGACVRAPKGGGWERHVGLRQLPIASLGIVSDEDAQQLTIVLNETRGTYDQKKMGQLLIDLVAVKPLAELVTVLPFTKPKFEELAALPKVDWGKLDAKPPAKHRGERWVERVYRLPADAAEVLDRAVRSARDEDDSTEWQALQRIAEDFLRP